MIPQDVHLTSLFENTTEGILIINRSGMILLSNPSAEKIFGYKKGELTNRPLDTLIPFRFRSSHSRLAEEFFRHPANRPMGRNRDLFGLKKDGTEIPIEVSLSYYDYNGELFVTAFIIDISKRKEIEENMLRQQKELEKVSNEIKKLNAELEAKVQERTMILTEALQRLEQSQKELSQALKKEKELNEIKSRFVSMASHEFRTPLSTVLSSASLLARYNSTGDEEKRLRHIEKIKNSVKHLNDLLEDFLSLGKLDEGKVEVRPQHFSLPEFIEDITEEMKGLMKKGQLIRRSHTGSPEITSDKKLLKNILFNLLSNAIKFSPEDQPIDLESEVTEDHFRLCVTDRGIGISEADQQHLFTSFFRAGNALNIQGTGLGLHLVKRYTDLLKGSLDLQSELNKGTRVTLTFPLRYD
ncbi:MAG: PAS domain-containing sensor histidine kinase [Chitinophagaceae bacterium]|nr:PAS domain-containing sensor histidine kinase [Chitinophagaceae bacterium]